MQRAVGNSQVVQHADQSKAEVNSLSSDPSNPSFFLCEAAQTVALANHNDEEGVSC